jgi:hypothetical protein
MAVAQITPPAQRTDALASHAYCLPVVRELPVLVADPAIHRTLPPPPKTSPHSSPHLTSRLLGSGRKWQSGSPPGALLLCMEKSRGRSAGASPQKGESGAEAWLLSRWMGEAPHGWPHHRRSV